MTSREWIEKEYGTSHLHDVMLMEDLSTILDIMQEYGDDRSDSQKSSIIDGIISESASDRLLEAFHNYLMPENRKKDARENIKLFRKNISL